MLKNLTGGSGVTDILIISLFIQMWSHMHDFSEVSCENSSKFFERFCIRLLGLISHPAAHFTVISNDVLVNIMISSHKNSQLDFVVGDH